MQPLLALAQQRLRSHPLRDVIHFDKDRGGRARPVLDRLIDEVEHACFVDAVAHQPYRLPGRAKRDAGREHAVEQVHDSLLDDLGQRLGDSPSQQVAAPGQLMISGVGECKDMLRSLQQGYRAGRLLKQFVQPLDLSPAFAL